MKNLYGFFIGHNERRVVVELSEGKAVQLDHGRQSADSSVPKAPSIRKNNNERTILTYSTNVVCSCEDHSQSISSMFGR